MFTSQHRQQLEQYFGGAYVAAMGLRSSAGPMLEAAAASAYHEPMRKTDEHGWPIEFMPARQSSSGANTDATEIARRALVAVRHERKVRAALCGLDLVHVRALQAYYTPRPSWSPHGVEMLGDIRAVVIAAFDEDEVRALVRAALEQIPPGTTPDQRKRITTSRVEARRSLGTFKSAATKLLSDAREAYAEAEGIANRLEREQRSKRLSGASLAA